MAYERHINAITTKLRIEIEAKALSLKQLVSTMSRIAKGVRVGAIKEWARRTKAANKGTLSRDHGLRLMRRVYTRMAKGVVSRVFIKLKDAHVLSKVNLLSARLSINSLGILQKALVKQKRGLFYDLFSTARKNFEFEKKRREMKDIMRKTNPICIVTLTLILIVTLTSIKGENIRYRIQA